MEIIITCIVVVGILLLVTIISTATYKCSKLSIEHRVNKLWRKIDTERNIACAASDRAVVANQLVQKLLEKDKNIVLDLNMKELQEKD